MADAGRFHKESLTWISHEVSFSKAEERATTHKTRKFDVLLEGRSI